MGVCEKSFWAFFLVDYAEQRLPLIACFNHCSNYCRTKINNSEYNFTTKLMAKMVKYPYLATYLPIYHCFRLYVS